MLSDIPKKYIWEEEKRHMFIEKLQCTESREKINSFLAKAFENNKTNIDEATSAVTDIFNIAASKTFKKAKASFKNTKKQSNLGQHF